MTYQFVVKAPVKFGKLIGGLKQLNLLQIAPPNPGKQNLIILADDEDPFREIVRDFLSQHGFQVIAVENGLAALNALDKNPGVDLLIIDWNMPVLAGPELLVEFSLLPACSQIAVIIISGSRITLSSPQVVSIFSKAFRNGCVHLNNSYCPSSRP